MPNFFLQVISLVDQQQPLFPGSIAPQPEIESNNSETINDNDDILNSVENGILRSTGVIAATILPASSSEKKFDAQQVITLVNQPSVSSPVAIQPSAQQVFDFYRPGISNNQDIENNLINQENIWHNSQQHIIAVSQDVSIVPQVTTSQQLLISQQINNQQQLTMPQQQSHQIISLSQYPQNSFPQSHEFHYSGENNLSHSVKSHEVISF